MLDALPFLNDVVTIELDGGALRSIIEQGISLEAGMVQVSGLKAHYDLRRPPRSRLISLEIDGRPADDHRRYRVATNSFLAEGGDGYNAFRQGHHRRARRRPERCACRSHQASQDRRAT